MILNNFIDILLCQGLIDTGIRGEKARGKRIDGDQNDNYGRISINNHYTDFETIQGNKYNYSSGYCLAFGTSDAPVTVDDYTWEHNIAGLTSTSWSMDVVTISDSKKLRITETVTNTTNEDITVKEIGLIVCGIAGNIFLVAREVLSEPILIKSGGVQVLGIDLG